jgi:hypothetical protein
MIKRNTKEKTFMVKAILTGEKVPDFGLGKGVIHQHEVEFTVNLEDDGFNIGLAMIHHENTLKNKLIRFEWREL